MSHTPNARIFLPGLLGILLWISPGLPGTLCASPSAAREWNEELLDAIRIDLPNPPAHARNLFHTGAAMYNAWAAYDGPAVGYVSNEKAAVRPADVENARREAVSYAAYRVIRARFAGSAGRETTWARLDARLTAMGYSTVTANAPLTAAATPAELGKRAGQTMLDWGNGDGFDRMDYPVPYTAALNPNLSVPLPVLGTNALNLRNMPLGFGIPAGTDPNLWQPLSMDTMRSQNGLPLPGGVQSYMGLQALAATPFSLTRHDAAAPWIDPYHGPSRLSTPDHPSPGDAVYKNGALEVLRACSRLNSAEVVDISPGHTGNNPLGSDAGTGHPVNPVTAAPWEKNEAALGDYARVLAEFWADGPRSETPPGHWHVLANEVSQMPGLEKRIGGRGPVVNDLEWDVKTYFALGAAVHDAACAAWSLKRFYSGVRPVTMIRYMGAKGQSSNPAGPSYHPQGLLLEDGVCEVITAESAAGRHSQIWDVNYGQFRPGTSYTGKIAVYSWPGEHPDNAPPPAVAANQSTLRWMLAKDWLPFQRKTFNTPAFPGYISGHSTFSRAAAETLALLTGSIYFPGGYHHHRIAAGSLQIDLGPGAAVDLQWCTYFDAADQAGQSRRWGGIHVFEDDYHGREVGAIAGRSAFALAEQYWTGTILDGPVQAQLNTPGQGGVRLSWNATRGMTYKVQSSASLQPGTWVDETGPLPAYDDHGGWTDPAFMETRKFYRVVQVPQP